MAHDADDALALDEIGDVLDEVRLGTQLDLQDHGDVGVDGLGLIAAQLELSFVDLGAVDGHGAVGADRDGERMSGRDLGSLGGLGTRRRWILDQPLPHIANQALVLGDVVWNQNDAYPHLFGGWRSDRRRVEWPARKPREQVVDVVVSRRMKIHSNRGWIKPGGPDSLSGLQLQLE